MSPAAHGGEQQEQPLSLEQLPRSGSWLPAIASLRFRQSLRGPGWVAASVDHRGRPGPVRGQDLAYAERLEAAGVPVRVHPIRGGFHDIFLLGVDEPDIEPLGCRGPAQTVRWVVVPTSAQRDQASRLRLSLTGRVKRCDAHSIAVLHRWKSSPLRTMRSGHDRMMNSNPRLCMNSSNQYESPSLSMTWTSSRSSPERFSTSLTRLYQRSDSTP